MASANVGFGASDLFAMAANFHEQSSSSILNETMANIRDANGNYECETGDLNSTTEYNNSFAYCNASPDIASDLGTSLSQFGDVFDSKKMVGMTINFTAGQYATVEVTGHQHTENAHVSGIADGYTDASAAIPASAGFGVPTLTGQTIGAGATPISMTITLSCDHVDTEDEGGDHFVGKNIAFKAEVTATYTGSPTTVEGTGWTTDSEGDNDSNSEYDGYTYTAHRYFDAATS